MLTARFLIKTIGTRTSYKWESTSGAVGETTNRWISAILLCPYGCRLKYNYKQTLSTNIKNLLNVYGFFLLYAERDLRPELYYKQIKEVKPYNAEGY